MSSVTRVHRPTDEELAAERAAVRRYWRQQGARHAAMTRKGIEWRSPEERAALRRITLMRQADPVAPRLLACDLAAEVLPIYEAAYPDDHRPHVALEVARRYARGEAGERERLAALKVAVSAAMVLEEWPRPPTYAVVGACGFCLWKQIRHSFEYVVRWAADARGSDAQQLEEQERVIALLETLQLR